MAIGLNSDSSSRVVINDSQGVDLVTNNVPRFRVESTGQQSSVVPNGTTLLPEFKCRAFANFDGSGNIGQNQTVRASGNVSSITKTATGDYTVNLITAMPDTNYVMFAASTLGNNYSQTGCFLNPSTSSQYRIINSSTSGTFYNELWMYTAVFR